MKMQIGNQYNWKYQTDRLIYLGKKGHWHQFAKVEDIHTVWCQVMDADLHMLEETA